MKLCKRLFISYAVVLAFLAALAFLLVLSIGRLSGYKERMERAYIEMDYAKEFDRTANRQIKELLDTILIGHDKDFEEFDEYTERAIDCLEEWEKLVTETAERLEGGQKQKEQKKIAAVTKIKKEYEYVITETKRKSLNSEHLDITEVVNWIEHELDDNIFQMAQKIIEDNASEVLKAGESIDRVHTGILYEVSGFIVVTFFVVIILCVVTARSVTGPLEKLKKDAEKISNGNLNIEIKPESKDEVGELAVSFSQMTKRLRNTIEDLNAELKRRKETEWELVSSNEELAQFAYLASHDLKEPMRKILAFTELLQNSLAGRLNADEQENFDFVIEGAERMNQLVEGLLNYSKMESHRFKPRTVDLNHIIENIQQLDLAELLKEKQGIIESPEPLPEIIGDITVIRQILQNLISNGLKYSRAGVQPIVVIRARNMDIDSKKIRIEVSDNGAGIEKRDLLDLFKMFRKFRLESGQISSGSGLALCKRLVSKFGGDIGITSEPGQGTTVWFTARLAHSAVPQKSKA